MTTKYVTRPARLCEDEWAEPRPGRSEIMVHEPENEPIRTGLYDVHGGELWRIEEPEPIGYVRGAWLGVKMLRGKSK